MQLVENRTLERAVRVAAVCEETPGHRAVLERAALLECEDRLLVELALRGVPHRQIAAALHLAAGNVTRRLHRLGQRLHDPRVIALLDPHCPLEPKIRQLGVERLLVGLTETELARKHEMSRSEIKKQLEFLNGWHRGSRQGFAFHHSSKACGRKVTRNQLFPSPA